ncbi:MAG: hypothetical protein O3A93_01600 [Chloroflexi bacterium]|nr:hypothetical protein [Chloroflexota bacterium]MDA1269941.1 hypothetical protein [Chloroflexota bacterium]
MPVDQQTRRRMTKTGLTALGRVFRAAHHLPGEIPVALKQNPINRR